MSNTSQQPISESSSLDYSSVSSQPHKTRHIDNHSHLSSSLQYLDRIRSINKKVLTSSSSNQPLPITPLEKLINSNREITYIDNERLYGIIKIELLTNLKKRVDELQKIHQSHKQDQHEISTKNLYLEKEVQRLRGKEIELTKIVEEIRSALTQETRLRHSAEAQARENSSSLMKLTDDLLLNSKQYLSLKNDFQSLQSTLKNQQHHLPSSHQMIFQTQTQFYKPTIQITPFQPNLEEILRKIREKQGQKISRPTLKQIVSQSLDAFVKELDSQYKLIHEQTIDLTSLREANQTLVEQNSELKKKLDELNVEEEKLRIFRNCMTEFLNDASQNVSKSIEAERIRKRLYEQLTEEQRTLLSEGIPLILAQNSELDRNNPEVKQVQIMKENMDYLKKENIELLRTIGEYQHKMKKVENVLEENKKEEIPDDGTVGQLVKMSKLVKQSIKNLLQEL